MLLNNHHVIERFGLSAADHAFLASSVIFIAVGWLTVRANFDQRV